MDVFEKLGIKIPNAVLVGGTTYSECYEEVVKFLVRYGKINRRRILDELDSEFNKMIVKEFESGLAIDALKPALPYTFIAANGNSTNQISDFPQFTLILSARVKLNLIGRTQVELPDQHMKLTMTHGILELNFY